MKDNKYYCLKGKSDSGFFDSIDDALECDTCVKIGENEMEVFKISFTPKLSFFIPDIEQVIIDQADCGDFSDVACESLLDGATKEQIKELEDSIAKITDEWADKYNHHPTFYQLEKVDEIKVNVDKIGVLGVDYHVKSFEKKKD